MLTGIPARLKDYAERAMVAAIVFAIISGALFLWATSVVVCCTALVVSATYGMRRPSPAPPPAAPSLRNA